MAEDIEEEDMGDNVEHNMAADIEHHLGQKDIHGQI